MDLRRPHEFVVKEYRSAFVVFGGVVLTPLIWLLLKTPASAQAQDTIAAIGPHTPLFRVEKNENPRNVMIAYTRLDDNCQALRGQDKAPIFDFYLAMDGTRFKPVHPLKKNGIRQRFGWSGTRWKAISYFASRSLGGFNLNVPSTNRLRSCSRAPAPRGVDSAMPRVRVVHH